MAIAIRNTTSQDSIAKSKRLFILIRNELKKRQYADTTRKNEVYRLDFNISLPCNSSTAMCMPQKCECRKRHSVFKSIILNCSMTKKMAVCVRNIN